MTNAKLLQLSKYNPETFERIYKSYYNVLYRFAYHYIMSDDARDIVQEVFMEFYEQKRTLGSNHALIAYLFTLTRNRCLNFLKHQEVIDKHESGLIDAISSWNNSEVEEDIEIQQILNHCIELLSPQQQQILHLRIEGMSYAEIATVLDINTGTINTHIARAYKIIREKFPSNCLFYVYLVNILLKITNTMYMIFSY